MLQSPQSEFESFLVEDMILTLGNLRGSLRWLGAGAGHDRLAIERLDRQIGLLEDRARRMCRALREETPAGTDNLFAPRFTPPLHPDDDDAAGDIAVTILDASAGDADGRDLAAPAFRSRRA